MGRPLHEKEHGRIVDYVGSLGNLDQALTSYREFAGYDESDVAHAMLSLHDEAQLLPDRHAALLDMFTGDELQQFLHSCAAPRCPLLLTLSVVGHVECTPPLALDRSVMAAFNDHQRRERPHGRLIGPDAAGRAVDLLDSLGYAVTARPSTWHLDSSCAALLSEWFDGWMHAAFEQEPSLVNAATDYMRQRMEQMGAGTLRVQVHHVDILAVPR